MYVNQRPSGLAAGPTTANPTGGMITIAGRSFSPWLLVGVALAYYAAKGAWKKVRR
jgi:hypothetical protein